MNFFNDGSCCGLNNTLNRGHGYDLIMNLRFYDGFVTGTNVVDGFWTWYATGSSKWKSFQGRSSNVFINYWNGCSRRSIIAQTYRISSNSASLEKNNNKKLSNYYKNVFKIRIPTLLPPKQKHFRSFSSKINP